MKRSCATMELPPDARAKLVRPLLLILEPEEADEDSEGLWRSEIEVRIERVEKGVHETQDWQKSVRWLHSRLKRPS